MRTLRYWVSRYRTGLLLGLAPKRRSDRGESRVRYELREFAVALALSKPRRTAASIAEEVAEEASRRGWKPPSYRQVLGIVNGIDPQLMELAHGGTKAHKQNYDLIVRFEAAAPNERWQVDHKQLKVWLKDEDSGRLKKPWLTAIEDDHSRAIPGYYLHFCHPSAVCVALAFRQAMWTKADPRWPIYGVPDVFYNDNGPDFKSRHIEQVAANLGVRVEFSMPYEPRGRGKIERLFKVLDKRFLPRVPGFLPEGKPDGKQEHLTLAQLDHRLREWILDVYHLQRHGETKQAPLARWEANKLIPRVPDSLEELDLLLLTVADTRKVQREGVRFKNSYYHSLALAAYVGEAVVIRYDPRDLGEVRVYHEGRFLCRAVSPERVGGSFTFKDASKANSRNRKALREELRDKQAKRKKLVAEGCKESPPVSAAESAAEERAFKGKKRSYDALYDGLKGYENE